MPSEPKPKRTVGFVLRTIGLAVWQPRRAFEGLTTGRIIAIAAICIALEAGAYAALMFSRPAFVVDLQKRVIAGSQQGTTQKQPVELEKLVDQRLRRQRDQVIADRTQSYFFDTALLFCFWAFVGTVVYRTRDLKGVLGAIVLANIVTTIEFVTRLVLSLIVQGEPGRITIAGLVGLPSSNRLNHVKIFALWWAYVASSGLAASWRMHVMLVFPLVVALTLTWLMYPELGHWIVNLPAQIGQWL